MAKDLKKNNFYIKNKKKDNKISIKPTSTSTSVPPIPWWSEVVETTIDKFEVGSAPDGGYTNDPSDSGGETKWGISKKAHPELDIKNLTKEKAIEIYANNYLNYNICFLDPAIGFKIYDMGVLQGKQRSEKIFQSVLSKISGSPLKEDGEIGIVTITVYNNYIFNIKLESGQAAVLSPEAVRQKIENLYEALVKAYTKRLKLLAYLKPKNLKYLKGWLNRVQFRFVTKGSPMEEPKKSEEAKKEIF